MKKKQSIFICVILMIIICSCSTEERLYRITLRHNKQCGFINSNGEMIIPADYSYVYDFTEGLACVTKDGQSFYIDKNNTVVLKPNFKNAMPFSDGYAVVSENLKYGFINKKGMVVIPLTYNDARSFNNEVAWVKENEKWLCINKNNKILFSGNYKDVNDFKNNYAVIISNKNEKKLIDKEGKEIDIPAGYEIYRDYVDNNEIIINKENNLFSFNIKTREIKSVLYKNQVFFDSTNQKYGLKKDDGTILIEAIYDYLSRPDEKGYVLCGIGEDWNGMKFGYLSETGDVLIPIIFYQLDFFDGDMAVFLPRSVDGGYVRRDGVVFYAKDYL